MVSSLCPPEPAGRDRKGLADWRGSDRRLGGSLRHPENFAFAGTTAAHRGNCSHCVPMAKAFLDRYQRIRLTICLIAMELLPIKKVQHWRGFPAIFTPEGAPMLDFCHPAPRCRGPARRANQPPSTLVRLASATPSVARRVPSVPKVRPGEAPLLVSRPQAWSTRDTKKAPPNRCSSAAWPPLSS